MALVRTFYGLFDVLDWSSMGRTAATAQIIDAASSHITALCVCVRGCPQVQFDKLSVLQQENGMSGFSRAAVVQLSASVL